MNLHMAQNILAETELRHLAAIPYQIVSPATNSPLVGIYQDSMLGCFQFTRPNIYFTPREAMNLLMSYSNVNTKAIREAGKKISNFQILSQIMKPITLNYKNKLYTENPIENNIIEIRNGQWIRGQIEKSVVASTTKGILHRIFNDFGPMACANYIDDLQNIITEYMKTSSFSVGISDLIANKNTMDSIIRAINKQKIEVQSIIEKIHLGIFENNTANDNMTEFESQVNRILNKATDESGRIGRDSLSKDNRFLQIVSSGSKGNLINISQMISGLGQQNVDGKRIPYGFDSRTLPHYFKYDDSPAARGFIENSYISGLTAPELFFHAMGGRIGLIDTAVKTSQTGYIQRRLIKGLEDIKVEYDMTVRNSKGVVVQFAYGEDGFDTTRVENQIVPLTGMSLEDIYLHYDILGINEATEKDILAVYTKATISRMKKQKPETRELCKTYIDKMIKYRNMVVKSVFKYKNDNSVKIPVSFQNIIANIQGQMHLNANSIVDITPMECFKLVESYYEKLKKLEYVKPNMLFELLYYYYLSPKDLLVNKRFHSKALVVLLETILLKYKQAIVHPGEMVGIIAGHSYGEPTTQLSNLRSEKLKIIRVNKTTKNPEMISGEIGDICDKLIETLPEYTFNTGHKDSVETLLEPLDYEYYIIGVDEKEKTHWNKISHVSRHIVNGDMIRVKTKSGREVTTTMSHSHLIRKDQSVQPILGEDLKVGMRIPVAKHIENSFVSDTVQIGDEDYELDYLFGWFIGAYLSEGSLTKKKGKMEATGSIKISNISDYYVEHTKQFAGRFERKCRIREKCGKILGSEKYYKGIDTSFSCKPLADFIMNTCGTGSFVKRVPDFAFLAPNEFKAGLISGFFDGDGNFMCDKLHHCIRVLSRSSQLIKDVSLLLGYFDIFGSLHTNYRNGANYYHLAISAKYAKLYQDNIGTNLHKEKLQNLVDYYDRTDAISLREDIDKINGLGDIIAKCGKILVLEGQSRNYGRWKKKDSIGRSTLQKYIEIFKTHEKSSLIKDEIAILQQAANSGVIWDEIVEINQYTPDQKEYVYDFTVPGNQTFMTDYGVIVHNTLNSVTYDTEICVRDANKNIFKKKIGEFTEEQIKLSKKIDYMKDKDTTYAELSDYYEVPCATKTGETVWRRIEAVTQHPVINEDGTNTMLKVTTKGNREVTATKAKSFLQLIDGEIQQVNGKDLKVGDYLPVSKKELEYKEQFYINLREILPPTEYIYGSEIEKAKKVVNEYHWWQNHSGKTFVLPYSRSDSAYILLSENTKQINRKTNIYKDGFVYTKTNSICNYTIPEQIPLDYEFGYLVGAYAAEGCMTKHQVSISNNDIEYLKPIIHWCDKYNITTKIYKRENVNSIGWTSQDVRIYNTILCRILSNLCGNLSHNKYVSSTIVFSNKECILGFLDAYIGGDGFVQRHKKSQRNAIESNSETHRCEGIQVSSVSYKLLLDVQIMLKNLGIIGNINKPKKAIKNNRGTLPENIKQPYNLTILNQQGKKLANLLNIKVEEKQNRCKQVLSETFKYEYSREHTIIPNIVNGELTMQPRNNQCPDLIFDKVISIEEVKNPTSYAYDLTVEDTRNFDIYNSICLAD